MNLKNLSLVTFILFLTSLFVYHQENKRGTDLLSGSDYIKGLDVNKIQKISLTFENDKKITLTRDSNKFVLENHKSYPASTEKVNDLIYKIASIQVKEKVDTNVSDKELEKYDLSKDRRKYLVELYDNQGAKTVSFSVGKSHKGKGNYLHKDGKNDVYLSSSNVWINSSYKDFISTVLLEVNEDEVEKLSLNIEKPLEIVKKDNDFIVAKEDGKEVDKKSEKASEYVKNLKSVSFDDFHPLNDPKVLSLNFDKNIRIKLKNKLVYDVKIAKDKDDHFVKLQALMEDAPKEFVVNQNDGKKELQKIEDVIKAQTEAQKLNLEKGAWVYKIKKSVFDKLVKKPSYFL